MDFQSSRTKRESCTCVWIQNLLLYSLASKPILFRRRKCQLHDEMSFTARLVNPNPPSLEISGFNPRIFHLSDPTMIICLLGKWNIGWLLSIVLVFLWEVSWWRQMESKSFNLLKMTNTNKERRTY